MTQPKLLPRNSVLQNKMSSEVDCLGNTCLHNALGRYDIQEDLIQEILQTYPHFASYCNFCGRLPLHYAVDRGRININALELLLDSYPQGMLTKDTEGVTPFDIVRKWEHDSSVQWMFLNRMSAIEKVNCLQMPDEPVVMISRFFGSFLTSGKPQRSESLDEETLNSDDEYVNDDEDQLLSPLARKLSISNWIDHEEEEKDEDFPSKSDMKRQKITYTENIQPFSFDKDMTKSEES